MFEQCHVPNTDFRVPGILPKKILLNICYFELIQLNETNLLDKEGVPASELTANYNKRSFMKPALIGFSRIHLFLTDFQKGGVSMFGCIYIYIY
ncbi:hypothetical protein GWI33_021585 [Rhynchophorus ferrugineus]|uniref:Uncharacterized protein n=1 Tax=Rhynchophorus ferrugineus TaxID=354439 RepID=A0A834IVS9_RHYFE|nr:hypothetical protein GWI33_021585 [Rhynchophorus ferrugineus]